MHKRLKHLISNIKTIFSIEFLDSLSKDTGFVKRKSKINAETFLAFNTFSSHDMCRSSLSNLCGRLAAQYNVSISPQALNERFNESSVTFMQEVFHSMIIKQNEILNYKNRNLKFNRLLVNDATSYQLPQKFYNDFKGCRGTNTKSAIKIQLQYDLLSGKFICCDVYNGAESDASYVDVMNKHTEAGDLRLADLGYYNTDYFKKIDEKKAFYISKLKSTSAICIKNPNPKFKKSGNIVKSTEYIRIDILEIIKPLADGETIEIKDVYIGSKKELKSRLIITKLSEENKQKRKHKHLNDVRQHAAEISTRSLAWTSVNVYITNVPERMLDTEKIHDVYSLRWQIEIMFKIWKSIFNINNVKNIKMERFKCFLYGRLISLLLSSSIVFTSRDIIYEKDDKEISEIKSFSQVHEFFIIAKTEIFKGEIAILTLLGKIINAIRKFGIKSRKKGYKPVNKILNYFEISNGDLVNMVI